MQGTDVIQARIGAVAKYPVNNPCCVCDSTKSSLLFETEFPQYGYPGSFAVRCCDRCGLLFNSPRVSDDALSTLYDAGYYFHQRDDASEIQRIVPMYRRVSFLVEQRVPCKNALEIGSGNGYLVALMQQMGWTIHGVDLSPIAVARSEETFGVKTFLGDLEEFAETVMQPRYDLVLAIDLIEHIGDPSAFMEGLRRVVKPGGLVYVDTPNADSRNLAPFGHEWKGFNPYHIYLFTPQNLDRLLERHGFVVEVARTYGDERPGAVRLSATTWAALREGLRRTRLLGMARLVRRAVRRRATPIASGPELIQRVASRFAEASSTDTTADDLFLPPRDLKGDTLVMAARRG